MAPPLVFSIRRVNAFNSIDVDPLVLPLRKMKSNADTPFASDVTLPGSRECMATSARSLGSRRSDGPATNGNDPAMPVCREPSFAS